jgi:hydroxymethylpyrimidine/phosphomethylpyrimidine kinase
MSKEIERPRVLVVAGYDQSGGAGVLADVKTLEAHGVDSYAVCTALTFQNERVVRRVDWMRTEDVFEQIDLCFDSARFDWVKVGITPSMEAAGDIITYIKRLNPGVKVVLDPVIRASSGREFWTVDDGAWEAVAQQCYLVTPNWEEIRWLYPDADVMERCRELSGRGCNIYLKGGHHPAIPGRDYLWSRGEVQMLDPEGAEAVYPKHGSGCVLASSLAANLASGYALPAAALRAKRYTEQFLTSNQSLLGWHRPLETSVL